MGPHFAGDLNLNPAVIDARSRILSFAPAPRRRFPGAHGRRIRATDANRAAVGRIRARRRLALHCRRRRQVGCPFTQALTLLETTSKQMMMGQEIVGPDPDVISLEKAFLLRVSVVRQMETGRQEGDEILARRVREAEVTDGRHL